MNSENSKTSDPHRLLLDLLDKINLKRSNGYVALWDLRIYYTCKIITKIMNLKCQRNIVWRGWITWWIIFCIRYFKYILKKHETVTDIPLIMIM